MSCFNNSFVNEKLDHPFNQLKCAAEANLAFGVPLRNIEDGLCKYFKAHENITIMDTSKRLCSQDDKVNLKKVAKYGYC